MWHAEYNLVKKLFYNNLYLLFILARIWNHVFFTSHITITVCSW